MYIEKGERRKRMKCFSRKFCFLSLHHSVGWLQVAGRKPVPSKVQLIQERRSRTGLTVLHRVGSEEGLEGGRIYFDRLEVFNIAETFASFAENRLLKLRKWMI